MRFYTTNESAYAPARSYGSDVIERAIAKRGIRSIVHIDGPCTIGCYLVTFDNGDVLDVSSTEATPHMALNSRLAIKTWLLGAIANAHKVAQHSAIIADENADLMALAIAGLSRDRIAA